MIEEREFMTSAVALNSATFNASRIVGPAFAGLAIAAIGSGGTFILNGVSFIAAIISLALIRFDAKIHAHHPRPLRAIKEGLAYSFGHERIRILMIASAVMSAFGFSYTSILPSITETVFHGGAASLGYLYAATGAGSLLAAIIMSAYANRLRPSFFIAQGSMLFALSLAGFGLATDFWLGLVFSFFIGLAFASVFSMMNSVIQHTVEDALRGRVMSIYILMFMGFMPAGSFAFGYGMDHWGSRIVMLTGALAVFAIACVLGIKKHVIDGIDG